MRSFHESRNKQNEIIAYSATVDAKGVSKEKHSSGLWNVMMSNFNGSKLNGTFIPALCLYFPVQAQ